MSEPLALLPLAVAAGGGRVGAFEAQQLVFAGLTLLQRSVPLVRALSGRRAGILLATSPQYFVALAASEGRGAVLANPLASVEEVRRQFEESGVGAVFTSAALADRVPEHLVRVLLDDAPRSARVLAGGASRDVDLGSHFGLDIAGDPEATGREEEAAIVYTSAMAGRPLGAILTHRNLLANARSTVEALALKRSARVLALLPWAHLFGLTVTGTGPLLAGATIETLERFSPRRALELVIANRTTLLVAVPGVFRALLTAIAAAGEQTGRAIGRSLEVCICGGAVLPVELQDRWFDTTGVELRQGYGLTEGAPVCLFNRVDRPNVRGTLGVPFPHVEVALRVPVSYDDEGRPRPHDVPDRPVPAGEAGEICVRGENVFKGYVRDGEAGLVVRDGWLHTGDLGRRNADGTFEFVGLVKPMFTRNGFNIYPREIEAAVEELGGVARARVRAEPNAERENDIVLEVEGTASEADVRRWCQERLAAYKQPAVVTVA